MTATLAVLGAQAVLVTFIIENRTGLLPFYIASAFALVALVLSFIFGGIGIYEVIRNGQQGDWRVRTKGGLFNWQAILSLVGTVMVVASAFLGRAR